MVNNVMPVIDHALRSLSAGDPLLKPFLDVRYINPHSGLSIKSTALIDTGADNCILPIDFAELLDHTIEKGEPADFVGISGHVQRLYKHTMQIQIDGHDFSTPNVMIAFSPTTKHPILGVKTFLSHFVLTINYPGKTFSLKLPTQDQNLSVWGLP
jgi:predicted aspartyl protease